MNKDEYYQIIKDNTETNKEIKMLLSAQNTQLSRLSSYTHGDVDEAYQRGLNDAWEMVKEISLLSPEEAEEIFPGAEKYNRYNLGYSGAEAMKAYQTYQQQKEDAIKIGDEVRFNHDDIRAVILDQADKEETWWLYTENGCIEEWQEAYVRKTGRTFPQIAEVLQAMQKGSES